MKFPKAFDYWGGATDLARAIGLQPGAIYTWRYNDSVPKRYEAQVRKLVATMKEPVAVKREPTEGPALEKPEPVKDVKLSDIAALVLRYLLAKGL